ncbi:hypothetical protein ACFFF5_06945 [Lederbergia wuyishanensis]|uniref:YhfM-like domain-containing protein n=1 Tax=Lederbergia wuyishanensis TaxID=1347903 RepID=A0ABU0D2K6_9BACI|nr:hypothetical protein [Lederbergia wuyishanensis]MCJ8007226.1 hypothetical protein [Lederbergia wuyishanensis]MDQ0342624.1 hypothetical protein [Lederbergia wuyishanensis]
MKKVILFLSLLGVLLVTSGCLNEMIGQKITIQKRIGEENIFEDFKEVTKRKQVKKAIDIVKNANWENEKVEMASYADYQFQFPPKNYTGSEGKMASYLLWISSNGENLEIVTDGDRYVKLKKQESTDLYKILTGEELIK